MSLSQSITQLVQSARRELPDCIGAAVVDLSTGMLLSAQTRDNHPHEILDVLSAATADLFQGRQVRRIEELWRRQRGETDDPGGSFQEILINSRRLAHLFVRSNREPDLVLTLVCAREVNVGMLLAQARVLLRDFDAQ